MEAIDQRLLLLNQLQAAHSKYREMWKNAGSDYAAQLQKTGKDEYGKWKLAEKDNLFDVQGALDRYRNNVRVLNTESEWLSTPRAELTEAEEAGK